MSHWPGTTVSGPTLRRFMRRWPGGIAVVTSAADTRASTPVGCTVSAILSVSLAPPLVLVSLSDHSRTLAAVTGRRRFCVNVLAESQRELAERFASQAVDRFADVPHRWEQGVPVLADTAATAVCEVERIMPVADHVLVLGTPIWCRQDDDADPVVFLDGTYHAMPIHA
jgi:flavin reductase (DIM6/NTAB) family NADH-FMN oxidoreductase RutF